MPIEDLQDTASYRIREKFEGKELISKLAMYGDVREMSGECYMFSPTNPDWPKAYIYEDGRIFVLTENHFQDEIDDFIENIKDIFGMEIFDTR